MPATRKAIPAKIVETVTAEVVSLRSELRQERETSAMLAESIAELERDLYEAGWVQALALSDVEFSADGLRQMRAVCRLYAIKNALVKRGLMLRGAYVWGKGVEITARANGKQSGEQDVQAVITSLLADPDNARAVTGPQARQQLEMFGLGTDGEVFIAAVARPLTGAVQLRTINADEIVDVITDPNDVSKPWFYRKDTYQSTMDFATGVRSAQRTTTWYPALDYRPTSKLATIGGNPVDWSTRVLHVAVNRPQHWLRGVPDAYAAIDWAKAYNGFLADWAKLMKSLAKFAWQVKAPGRTAAKARTAISTASSTSDGVTTASGAGTVATLPPDAVIQALSKSGATLDADSGRPVAAMVAAALGMPVTMLLGDPGVTGARATAETLDPPTKLELSGRRDVWEQAYRALIDFAILEAVRAPQGALKGEIIRESFTGREHAVLDGDTDTTVDFDWPSLDDQSVGVLVHAIAEAMGTGTVPPEQILRLLLTALGVTNVDGIVEGMLDADGNFVWPTGPPLAPQDRTDPGSMLPDGADGGGGGGGVDGQPAGDNGAEPGDGAGQQGEPPAQPGTRPRR